MSIRLSRVGDQYVTLRLIAAYVALGLHNALPEERWRPIRWASVPAACGARSVSIDSPYRCFWVR